MENLEEIKTLQQLEQERSIWEKKKRELGHEIEAEARRLEKVKEENMEVKMRIIVKEEIIDLNVLRYRLWKAAEKIIRRMERMLTKNYILTISWDLHPSFSINTYPATIQIMPDQFKALLKEGDIDVSNVIID